MIDFLSSYKCQYEALRYKVWACPIPGVEKGVAFGVRESKRYSIAQ